LWAQLGSRSADGAEADVLKRLSKPPIDYFKMFYGDTVLGGSASALRCGLDFFGPDHVVFASDCPFDPEEGPMFIREGIRSIEDLNLSARTTNALINNDIHTIKDLFSLSEVELRELKGFGARKCHSIVPPPVSLAAPSVVSASLGVCASPTARGGTAPSAADFIAFKRGWEASPTMQRGLL
jgi:hypothetical protein